MRDRSAFLSSIVADRAYFLAEPGEHAWDTTKDFAAVILAITFVPIIVAENTGEANVTARRGLAELLSGVREMAAPVDAFRNAVATGDHEFFVQNLGTAEQPELLLLTAAGV